MLCRRHDSSMLRSPQASGSSSNAWVTRCCSENPQAELPDCVRRLAYQTLAAGELSYVSLHTLIDTLLSCVDKKVTQEPLMPVLSVQHEQQCLPPSDSLRARHARGSRCGCACTSRKLVSQAALPLLLTPNQVPPPFKSLPARRSGCSCQKCAGAVGLRRILAVENVMYISIYLYM